MSQAEIDRAVARATGETRDFIENMGFSLMHISRPTTQQSGRAGGGGIAIAARQSQF